MVTFFYPADRVPINIPRRGKSKGNLLVGYCEDWIACCLRIFFLGILATMEKIDITAHLFWAIIHSGVWSDTVITSSNISVSSSSPFSLIFPNKNPVRFRELSSSSESAMLAETREELWECRTVPVSLVQDEEMTSWDEGCGFRTATKTSAQLARGEDNS